MQSIFNEFISRNLFVYVSIFCMTLVGYAVVLGGPFFFDDNIFIEHNVSVQNFDVGRIYTHSTTADSGISGDNFYRPNQQLIFATLIKIFGARPWIFHFVSIFFHSINGFLVFLLFGYLGLGRPYALLGAILFILHPIQTQAVSYISGLSEPLVTTSVLSVLILYIRQITGNFSKKEIAGIGVLTVISLFSKENAVILLGLLPILAFYFYKKEILLNKRRALWLWVFVTAIILVYLSLRFSVFNFTSGLTGSFGIVTVPNIYTESLYIRLVTFISTIWQYCKMILVPINLHYETAYFAVTSLYSFVEIFGLGVLIAGLCCAYRSLVFGRGIFFFSFFWFFMALLPVSGIIPTNAIYLEHWLYMPIIGVIFWCVYALQNFSKKNENSSEQKNHLFFYVVIIILFIYTVIDINRNLDWANPIRFYKNELKYTNSAGRIYANLGMEMADQGDCQNAILYYKYAIEVNDQYPQTHYNLGKCLETVGDRKNAIIEYNKSLKIDPTFRYSIERLRSLGN